MFLRSSRRTLLASAVAVVLGSVLTLPVQAAPAMKSLKVGVVSGPEEELAVVAKNVAKTKGLNIELINFDDYNLPNEALASKDIDANAFQTVPFLDAQVKSRHYKLAVLGKTWAEPLGFYSHKVKDINALPDKATIAIPNDPSNMARAINLLAKHHLIGLKKDAPALPTLGDVAENPHHFKLLDMDASQLPREIDDVTMTAINTNFLIPSGVDPKSALIKESRTDNTPYDNILVVRAGDENAPEMKILRESFQSNEVKKAMEDKFHGSILPAW